MSALKFWDQSANSGAGAWKYLAQGVKGDTGGPGLVAQANEPDTKVLWLDTSVSGSSGSVPVKGTTNQVLAKLSDADYDTQWVSRGAGTVTSIAVSSPLTGGPITDTGTIGLNQNAISIASSQVSGLGTASTRDVASAGDASSNQVVKGNDTRLSDARNPNLHASTHADGGSDVLTLSIGQITGLDTALSGKASTSQTMYLGTTAVAIDRASATGLSLTGVSIDGNAGTATALQTPRNINGTPFDGTAPITVTATPTDATVTDAKIDAAGLAQSSVNGVAITNWTASTTYAKGDLVNYLGVTYRRKAAGTSGSTFDSTMWNQVTPTIPVYQSPPTGTWIGTGARGPLAGDQTNVGGDLHVVPFVVNSPRTLDAVAVLTGTLNAGSIGTVGRIGIYNADANGTPTTLLRDCGTVPLTATASVQQISGLAQALPVGMYWIGCVVQSAGATIPLMVTNVLSYVTTPFFYTFQSTATTATNLDFSGNNTYRVGSITGALPTSPTWLYNSNSVSPIKVIWKFSA